MLIEDLCKAIDSALKPLTLNRAMFLIFIASIFFLLTLLGLLLVERKTRSSADTNIPVATSILFKVVAILCIIASITSFFLYVFKSTLMLRLPIEYFAGWFFYGLLLLLITIESLRYHLKTESNNIYKIMSFLIITIWFFMILGLTGDILGSSYAASEDAMDVMILSLEGHLFKSTHAPHYDLAPMHTFLYIIISQVLGLQLIPEQNTYAWELITVLLLTSLFLAFRSFIDFIETGNHERKKLLKLLVPILLTVHPYALGILSASHVNGLSGVLAFFIILVVFKNLAKGSIPTLSEYLLILLMMITSILMHPLGFITLTLALLSLAFLLRQSYRYVKRLATVTIASAFILFALKGLYTEAFQSLQTFASYMLEAFFSGFQRSIVLNVEIIPRTYQKVPVSANIGYVASLGILTGISLYILLHHRCLSKRKHNCNTFLLFILLNNIIVLALALASFFVVMGGISTKYVVGTYVSVMSLTILIYLSDLLKKREVRVIGFLILVLVLILSSLLSLISPLKTPTNYRVLQGSLPAFDQDIDFAIKLSNLVEPRLGERYIVIQHATPLESPLERNVGQALVVYASHAKFKVLYSYNTRVLDLDIVLSYWVFTLAYGGFKDLQY
jgi:hypothetical protein